MDLEDRSPAVLTTSAVFLGIATFFVAARCLSKFGIRRRIDTDDVVTIVAWLFTVALSVTIITGASAGIGKSDARIPPGNFSALKKSMYVFPIFYHLSSTAAKTAALLLYIRMASAHAFLRRASYAVLAVVDVSGVILVFLNIFQCRPVAAAWDINKNGQCIDLVTLFLASSPINILSDLAILILPLPIITSLRIERREKAGLVMTFLCGIFVAVVDVVRNYYLQSALKEQLSIGSAHVSAADRPPNYYWFTSYGLMWSAIECTVRVACCCALVLKPLLQRLRQTSRGSWHNSRSKNRSHTSPGGEEAGNEIVSFTSDNVKSPRNIQAILELDPDVPDEDTMDLAGFFAAGPPGGVPQTPHSSPTLVNTPTFPNMMSFTTGRERALTLSDDGHPNHVQSIGSGGQEKQAPANNGVLPGGAPLTHAATRLSMLTAPIRWMTRESVPIEQTQQPTQNFFDFVQMGGRKPLPELSAREAWWPVMFVSILFFMWGFSYGLLGTLSQKIMLLFPTNAGRMLALQNAYWIGYIIGPATVGMYVLPHHGFKATFMTGLVIYGCGTMCFWPSSVLGSYGGFVFCNILIGMGLSVLEVAANPFIALAGPGHLSEARLNFSQGIQGLGSIISPILANKALFNGIDGRVSLFDVQWCYLAVALFVLFLALVFFYVPLSEASDDDLEAETHRRMHTAGIHGTDRAWGVPARWLVICIGVAVMTMYVGAQESIAYYWNDTIAAIHPVADGKGDAFWDLTIGHGLFAAARFIASGVCYIGITPRLLLGVCLIGVLISAILAICLPAGNGAFACLLLVMFFEAPIFPTLFATALRGHGRHTKHVSIALTIAIGGTVVWESITWGVYNGTGNVRSAMIVVIVLSGAQIFYPFVLASNATLRRWVDPKWSVMRFEGNHQGMPGSISAFATAIVSSGALGAIGTMTGEERQARAELEQELAKGDEKVRREREHGEVIAHDYHLPPGRRRSSVAKPYLPPDRRRSSFAKGVMVPGGTVRVESAPPSGSGSGSGGSAATRASEDDGLDDSDAGHDGNDGFAGIGVIGDLPDLNIVVEAPGDAAAHVPLERGERGGGRPLSRVDTRRDDEHDGNDGFAGLGVVGDLPDI